MGNLRCMASILQFQAIPTPGSATPTTAWPPEWTWTCSTAQQIVFQDQLEAINAAQVRLAALEQQLREVVP
jgi:hypothetical protein